MLRSHETIEKGVITRKVNFSSTTSGDKKIWRLKICAVLMAAFITIAIGGWWILHNASQVYTEGFEIYLLDINEVAISNEDVVSYNKTSHEIKLTEGGAKKIEELSLKVPVDGTKFMIKINGKEIYGGCFWSPISSIPCSGVVIETIVRNNALKIETGYPSSHFHGEDPRNNLDVFNYFQAVGKLVD